MIGKEEIGKEEIGKEEIGKEEIGKEEIGKEEIGKEEIGKEEMRKEEIGKAAAMRHEESTGKNHLSKDIIKDISLVFILRSVSDKRENHK